MAEAHAARGSDRDYCSVLADRIHYMSWRKPAHSPIGIEICKSCGWIDGQRIKEDIADLLKSSKFVTAERERELLLLKGPCSNKSCRLHRAHAGPCAPKEES